MKKTGFTLVELLIGITLLSILTTLGVYAILGNISDSRDASRKSEIETITKNLDVFYVEKSLYPVPDDSVDITFSGAVVWKQGEFGKNAAKQLTVFGSEYPKDPQYKNNYTYSTLSDGSEFQIATILENAVEEEGLGLQVGFIPQAEASTRVAYVKGNYNGFMVKASSGSTEYFIATPSIIASDISQTDILSIISDTKLVYNNFFNLPASYIDFVGDTQGGFDFNVSDPLLFSGSISELRNEQNLLLFDSKLKYIYATTPTESFDKYINILEREELGGLKKFLTQKFKILFKGYYNCKEILDENPAFPNGNYEIDPDGLGGNPAYSVYCDMMTDGGGWTRVGQDQIINGNFSGGNGVVGAYKYPSDKNQIVSLATPVAGNTYALHQTGNYSSYYKIPLPDLTILKSGYELRMTLWRSDYGSGAVASNSNNVVLMGGKNTPWTLGTCTTGSNCYFKNFNSKLANSANFGTGGILTDISVTVKNSVSTVTNSYLEGGVLFDGFIPSTNYTSSYGGIYPYTQLELQEIDSWVRGGGFLISTNNESSWDPIGEYYSMPTVQYNDNKGVIWDVENVNHPLVNGTIGLKVDLRGKQLNGTYAHAALGGTLLPDDIVLARDHFSPFAPTVVLRRIEKGYVLFVSDDGMFVQMNSGNTFDVNNFETVFAASIMAYGIESAAGINPHEGYAFHNRIYYSDGTFSTNGLDETLDTITVNDGGTPRVWTKERVRHTIRKQPEDFSWYVGLDANNNKDLYFTGLELELFYR